MGTRPVRQISRAVDQHRQLLYFTSTSLTDDDRILVMIGEETGNPNLFRLDLATGEERQLTANAEGYLKSYVYFDGRPYAGLGKASVSLDPHTGTVFYIQGREIRKVLPDGTAVTLAEYPEGHMTGFTHVSADGTRLCVPTVEAAAFDGPPKETDARVQAQGLRSYLRVYDTATGELVRCERVERGWVTHVQFSPLDREMILYNHEWPGDCGVRRIWLFDGKARTHRPLRTEGAGRSREDWVCHEMWERDGCHIIYHGKYADGRSFLGRVQPGDGEDPVEIAFPEGWDSYGHFTVGAPGQLVSDGHYRVEGEPLMRYCPWICELRVDWDRGEIAWQPLCRHGSSWAGQDEHPHPIINHRGDTVYFTSDVDGKRAVYAIAAPSP